MLSSTFPWLKLRQVDIFVYLFSISISSFSFFRFFRSPLLVQNQSKSSLSSIMSNGLDPNAAVFSPSKGHLVPASSLPQWEQPPAGSSPRQCRQWTLLVQSFVDVMNHLARNAELQSEKEAEAQAIKDNNKGPEVFNPELNGERSRQKQRPSFGRARYFVSEIHAENLLRQSRGSCGSVVGVSPTTRGWSGNFSAKKIEENSDYKKISRKVGENSDYPKISRQYRPRAGRWRDPVELS